MLRIILGLLLLSWAAAVTISAQDKREKPADAAPEVVAVVNQLFAAMQKHDEAAISGVFTADGQLVAVDRQKDGTLRQRVFTAASFAKMIGAAQDEYHEKMPQPEVRLYGDLAIVSGRYTFHVGEKFSHCGTNSFHLIHLAEGWKIANGVSTLEFTCPET